jgi:hypothetical protein
MDFQNDKSMSSHRNSQDHDCWEHVDGLTVEAQSHQAAGLLSSLINM